MITTNISEALRILKQKAECEYHKMRGSVPHINMIKEEQ